MSEEDVKVSRREITDLLLPNVLWHKYVSSVTREKDSVMQNCSVKKWMSFLHCALKKEAVKK
jgi:hypothetical protein